jgi:crotonyl-CoA reductase
VKDVIDAVLDGASGQEIAESELPAEYLAACLHREDESSFAPGEADRDVRRTLHLDSVPLPAIAPDEALVAVMASAINYNTVWSARFEPVPTFRFLERYARSGPDAARHNLRYHVVGSDAAGVVVRTGVAVRHWKPGDKVVVHPVQTDEQDPMAQWDGMLPETQLAWGYETNFGGLAHFAVVKATNLLAKPAHLSWEEAACNTTCNMSAYRMLVSERGARMKQGDIVLIWGAAGGLGGYAVQQVKNGGGIAVGVVSSDAKRKLLEDLRCDVVLDRREFADSPAELADPDAWRRLGRLIRARLGEDPHIVFEHVGRETFAASLFVARRGGCVVTCGSSSGYRHEFDNRFLWMKLKRVIGSHAANYQESWEANRLISLGRILPTLSRVYPLDRVADATRLVQLNQHVGKVGVLCLAPREGLGVDDPLTRAAVGESRLHLFRDWSAANPT